jgi:hypothetical protein
LNKFTRNTKGGRSLFIAMKLTLKDVNEKKHEECKKAVNALYRSCMDMAMKFVFEIVTE